MESIKPRFVTTSLLLRCVVSYRQVLENERVRRPSPHGLGLLRAAGGAARHLDRDPPQGNVVLLL